MLASTMLAPVGVSNKTDTHIPIRKQTTETNAEQITTLLYFLHTLIAESDGKITRLEMSSAPISLIPRTMMSEVSTDTRPL